MLDPWRAPPAFLDWLIRITGARVEPGWPEGLRRKAVDLAPRLAAHRGTPYGLLLEAGRSTAGCRPASRSSSTTRPRLHPRRPGTPRRTHAHVTLTAPAGEDQRALESRLTRLVRRTAPPTSLQGHGHPCAQGS
ncbi:phage tail protein [Streptomyces cinnamoneus]|uniref:phage tail protein n=1 Tax=Streptomyces cinnamoneus TaxID=53446 RepID=UPI000D1ACD51